MDAALDWRNVGSLDDIPKRGARRLCFRIDGRPVAIFRTAANEVFALADACPHRSGPLSEGIVAGATVTCPLHNWTIMLEDGNALAPDRGSVATYPVKIIDGAIVVGVPAAAKAGV